MGEAAQARAALDAAQSAAQEMLEGRQALAAENVDLEERLLALRNEQLRAQQSGSEWESRVAAVRAEARRAEGAAAAALARKERERARLEERVAEVQGERERLLGRLKDLAVRKSGLGASEAAAMLAAAAAGSENGGATPPVVRAEAVAQTDEAAPPAQQRAVSTADAACQSSAAPSPRAAVPPAAVQQAPQPLEASAEVLRDPASTRIAATSARAERFAALDGVQRMPSLAAALLPPLHWGTGDAAASVADTQVTVLDNIHRLVAQLADSKAQLRAELAAAHAALARAGLAVPSPEQSGGAAASSVQSAAASPCRHVTIAASPPVELRTPPGGPGAPEHVSPDVLTIGAEPHQAMSIPVAPHVHSEAGPFTEQRVVQPGRADGGSALGLTAASLVAESAQRYGAADQLSALPISQDRHVVQPGLDVARSAHTTPAKPALDAAAVPQSAPATPADSRPARRRGWLGGIFGSRRPVEPNRNILTAA